MSALTPSSWQLKQPVVWLSAMWFCLCASLVHKHNDLIGVFCAFIGSFGLAFLLSQAPLDNNNTPESRQAHGRTKDLVGLVACTISFIFLGRHKGGEFQALAMSTGYLAFDLWFSSVYCRPIPPPVFSILQDALTLTAFLVSLSLHRDKLESYHGWILGWVAYKAMVFVMSLATRNDSPSDDAPKSISIVERQALVKVLSSKDKWTVHGIEYDLAHFVNLHPGGKEAVELGRGRDCTALFESYHPFTNKHRYVNAIVELAVYHGIRADPSLRHHPSRILL